MKEDTKIEIPESKWDDLIEDIVKKISPDEWNAKYKDGTQEIEHIQIGIHRNNPKYLVGIEGIIVTEIVKMANEHNVYYEIIITNFIFAAVFRILK